MTDQVEQKPDWLQAAADKVFDSFYVPESELPKSFLEECEDLTVPLKGAADAFVSNIESAARAASIPYTLTQASIVQRRFDRFYSAESIRALKKVSFGENLTVELKREAYEKSNAEMKEFLKSVEGIAEADFHADRLPQLAMELLQLKPDVIVATATIQAVALKKATDTIPIVIGALADPVELGLITSFARPGGNVTGIMPYVKGLEPPASDCSMMSLTQKRVRKGEKSRLQDRI